ncbi:MAG: hypothetical protein ACYCUD_08555 [Candidatus Dormibacteria bacterium]
MSGTSAALLVTAACLLGLATFALLHRQDAFGALIALLIGFNGVAAGLVGFAASAPTPAAAAQLQAYALLTEVLGVLCAGVGSALATVLRRRSGSDLMMRPALVAAPGSVDLEETWAESGGESAEGGGQALESEPEPDPGDAGPAGEDG